MKLPIPTLPARFPAIPPALARVVARLPAWPPSLAFAAACNRTAWPALRDLDWSPARGRRFRIHACDLGLSVYLSLREDGFHAEPAGPVAVTFTAGAEDFTRLALRLEDPDTLFFNRRLRIEGDTDLGLSLKNLLDALDWDALLAHMPPGLGGALRHIQARMAGTGAAGMH